MSKYFNEVGIQSIQDLVARINQAFAKIELEGIGGISYGGGGITKLSELEIDVDKDWAGHSIDNLKGINYSDIFSINALGINYDLNGAVLWIGGDAGEMLCNFNQALMVNMPRLELDIGGALITFDYLGGDNVLNIISSADMDIRGISALENSSVMYIHTPQLWIQTDPAGWLRFRYDSNNNEIVIDKVSPILINDQSGTGAWTRWRYDSANNEIVIESGLPVRIPNIVGAGIKKLSELEIDVSKDWGGFGIGNISGLSFNGTFNFTAQELVYTIGGLYGGILNENGKLTLLTYQDFNIHMIYPNTGSYIRGYSQDLFRIENINDAEQHVVDSIYHDDTLNLDIVGTRWAMRVGTTDYHIGLGLTYDVTNNIMHSGLISYLNDFEIYGKYETGVGIYNYGIGISQEWFIYPPPFGDRYNFAFIYGIDELNQGYNGIFGIGFSSSRRAFTEQHLRYVFYEKKNSGDFVDVGMILLGDITGIGQYIWKLNTTEGMFFSTDHMVWLQAKEFMWLRVVDEATATEYGGVMVDYTDYGYGYTCLYGQYGYLEFTNTDINLYSDILNFNVNVAGSISLSGGAIGITSTSGDITLNTASGNIIAHGIRTASGLYSTVIGDTINGNAQIFLAPDINNKRAYIFINDGQNNPNLITPKNAVVIVARSTGRIEMVTDTCYLGLTDIFGMSISAPRLNISTNTGDITLNTASGNLILHGLQSGNDPSKVIIGDTLSGNSEIDILPDVNDWGVGIQMVNAINNPYINKRYMNIWSDTLYISTNAGLIDMGSTGSGDIYIMANNNIYLNGSMLNVMCETVMGNTLYMQSTLNMQNNNIININSLIGSAINITSTSGNITLNPASAVDFSQKQSKNHVLEKWTTSTRPTNPTEGQIGYNTDTHLPEEYDGTGWYLTGIGRIQRLGNGVTSVASNTEVTVLANQTVNSGEIAHMMAYMDSTPATDTYAYNYPTNQGINSGQLFYCPVKKTDGLTDFRVRHRDGVARNIVWIAYKVKP